LFEKCASELAFFGYPPAIAIENRPLAQDLTAREIQGSVVARRLGELEGVVALIEKKHASRLQLLIQESDLRFEPLEGEASLERAQSLSAVLSPLKDSHTKDGIEALHTAEFFCVAMQKADALVRIACKALLQAPGIDLDSDNGRVR
jgi:hypothetical protein